MFKIYQNNDSLIIHDPTHKDKDFLKSIDPLFEVRSTPPPDGFIPNFQKCRNRNIGLNENKWNKDSDGDIT